MLSSKGSVGRQRRLFVDLIEILEDDVPVESRAAMWKAGLKYQEGSDGNSAA